MHLKHLRPRGKIIYGSPEGEGKTLELVKRKKGLPEDFLLKKTTFCHVFTDLKKEKKKNFKIIMAKKNFPPLLKS